MLRREQSQAEAAEVSDILKSEGKCQWKDFILIRRGIQYISEYAKGS